MANIQIVDVEERSVKAVMVNGLYEPSTHDEVDFHESRKFRCLDCNEEFFFTIDAKNHKC